MFNIFQNNSLNASLDIDFRKGIEVHDPFKTLQENLPARIMIVETSKDIREILSNFLTKKGSTVITCENAVQAIDCLSTSSIDIIISGSNLPVIDGIEFCSIVKEKFNHIYFILLTSKTKIDDIIKGLNTGVNECITKPFDFMEILAKIQAAENIISTHKKLSFLNERLEKYVNTDELTRLKNRRFFNVEVLKEIRRARRYKHEVAILMIDVDNFKKINDTYGHVIGDKVLKAIADNLVTSTRESDIVCRYGGEEFIVFFPEINKPNALVAAEKLRKNVDKMIVEIDNLSISPTISIGIVVKSPEMDLSLEELTTMADEALYRAKNSGKNKAVMYQ